MKKFTIITLFLLCLLEMTGVAQNNAVPLDEQTRNLITQANRKYSSWDDTQSVPEPLTMAIITDLHGDAENLSRFIGTCDELGTLIDERLELGDIVPNWFGQDFEFYKKTPGTDGILMVIGNHDTRPEPYSRDWTARAGKDAYEKYFAPFSDSWLAGVVQPADAAQEGKCWWYKDNPAQHVRIIGLDSMSWGETQTEWLEETLEDARSNGYSVLCVQHLPVGKVNPVSSFNSIDYGSYEGGYSGSPSAIKDAVEHFISNGGEFICWISGDSHYDFTGTLIDHPRQFSITFENGGCDDYWNDSKRVHGEKSQDSFNIVTVDTYSKHLKVVRIGNDCDRYLRSKKSFCVNYLTGELISNQ